MEKKTKISVRNLNLYYGQNHALKDVSMDIREKCVTAFIGPSGCGKSTFLRTLNRMNDLVENVRITGEVKLDNEDIYGENVDTTVLRKKIGDHAADISEMTIMMKKISYPKQLEDLKKMASETVLMLIRSIKALVLCTGDGSDWYYSDHDRQGQSQEKGYRGYSGGLCHSDVWNGNHELSRGTPCGK